MKRSPDSPRWTGSPVRFFALMLGLIAVSLAGCNFGPATGMVSGKVLLNGEPTGGFEVEFVSVDDGSSAVGESMEEGQYELVRGRGAGRFQIPAGEYRVLVRKATPMEGIPVPKVKIPPTYTDRNQTVLTRTVEAGKNTIDIELDIPE